MTVGSFARYYTLLLYPLFIYHGCITCSIARCSLLIFAQRPCPFLVSQTNRDSLTPSSNKSSECKRHQPRSSTLSRKWEWGIEMILEAMVMFHVHSSQTGSLEFWKVLVPKVKESLQCIAIAFARIQCFISMYK